MFPRKIVVGYQTRSGTYSGKLAYVIYKDEKGVLRKEKSWNSWRDKKIDPDEYDNVPLSGFVLNKHVGGHKSGWDFRQSYCRVYDPRGFEIEITMENLLYLLEWVDCLHGKGLVGEFVYMWNGTDIWLEPVCSAEYEKKKAEQAELFKNVMDIELVPGTEYKLKQSIRINKHTNELETSLIYVGEVKVDRGFGTGYTPYNLFIPGSQALCCGETDEVFFCFKDIANFSAVVKSNAITYAEVGNLMDRFNLSAYSQEFWNSPEKIKQFVARDVNFYHDPALEAYTKYYEKCFYVDPSGEYIHVHIPVVFGGDAETKKDSYYLGYYDTAGDKKYHPGKYYVVNSKDIMKGYFSGGKLTKDLLPIKVVHHDGTCPWDSTVQVGVESRCPYTQVKENGKYLPATYHIYEKFLTMFCQVKLYKKAESYFDTNKDNRLAELYHKGKYMYSWDEVFIQDFEGEHSDCWYETTDGYMSDSITRLNLFNHLNVQCDDHIALVMTLPYKSK